MRTNCPNCGAPLNSMGKCDYCGTIVTFNDPIYGMQCVKGRIRVLEKEYRF